MEKTGISIIIPIYNQVRFINRAIKSVLHQSYVHWEIIIVNDGSTDEINAIIEVILRSDPRIKYFENHKNQGLGYSLNKGIELAKYEYISYLPADDIYYRGHLASLFLKLTESDAIAAFSGLLYNYSDGTISSRGERTLGRLNDGSLQMVQVLHKKVSQRWTERNELVTDDLGRLFWDKLLTQGKFVQTFQVTAEWISHPLQRHKIISELSPGGGIHRYKQYYKVTQPLRYHSSTGHYIDEFKDYNTIRYTRECNKTSPLKILLVGELAYNPERICALEEAGHKLYGLWIDHPSFFNTTGPLPFGNVEDLPLDNWQQKIKEIKPDIIYAVLNSYAVTLAHEVLINNPEIPFVWHFKEGPFLCRQLGSWGKLVDLFQKSDAQIYINQENKKWFEQFLICRNHSPYVLDGDLPSKFYFKEERSKLLSDSDGHIHTVVSGRPFGIELKDIKEMAEQNIHLHIYGNVNQKAYGYWIAQAHEQAPDHLHLYHHCPPFQWTSEFSKYDAGWLHVFQSSNEGELMKMGWMDLNYPARMTTLAAAGLPMLQRNNEGHLVASQTIIKEFDMGVFFSSFEDLAEQLKDQTRMQQIRENCWEKRLYFSFDYHVEDLITFFRKVITDKKTKKKRAIESQYSIKA